MGVPLDRDFKEIRDLPYTVSYVIRKRMQIDSLSELPKDKKPSDILIWDESGDRLNKWLEDVLSGKHQPITNLVIRESEIED